MSPPLTALPATAVPPNTGDGYVAAAYIVFFAIVLVYVAIMAIRLTRLERNVRELRDRAQGPGSQPERPSPPSGQGAAPAPAGIAREDSSARPQERETV
jgi:hypothetical protein